MCPARLGLAKSQPLRAAIYSNPQRIVAVDWRRPWEPLQEWEWYEGVLRDAVEWLRNRGYQHIIWEAGASPPPPPADSNADRAAQCIP